MSIKPGISIRIENSIEMPVYESGIFKILFFRNHVNWKFGSATEKSSKSILVVKKNWPAKITWLKTFKAKTRIILSVDQSKATIIQFADNAVIPTTALHSQHSGTHQIEPNGHTVNKKKSKMTSRSAMK